MKPPAATVIETVGNFALGEEYDMGIDPANIEHIRMLLTDIYKDRFTAPIREYSTNAFDAHMMIGNTEPIQVTLPDAWTPFLKIRDFGPGMSHDLLSVTFSQYGSSTKRGENTSNGMFGIGGKAGLTYNNQFTVTSWHNGEKIVAEISRASGSTKLRVLYRGPSTERSGVEVSVPVKGGDSQNFVLAASNFYRWWKPGTVLVNGEEPAPIVLEHVVDNIHTTSGLGYDVVVMGNVAYPVERRLYSGTRPYGNSFDVVAFVDIGDVNIPPNRESLLYTDETDAVLADIENRFVGKIRDRIVTDIDAAPDHAAAYKRMVELASRYGSLMPAPAQYKGVAIPSELRFDHAMWNKNSYRYAYTNGNNRMAVETLINRSIVITNFTGLASLSKVYKDKIEQWKRTNAINVSYHVFVPGAFTEPWISSSRVVSWDTIKAEVLPGNTSSTTRKKPSIDVFDTTTGYTKSITDLDATKIPVYISPTARTGASEAKALYAAMPNVQIVSLGENRWEKFKRENPKAIPLYSAVKKAYEDARDALTPGDIEALSLGRTARRTLANLDHTKIDDPDVARMTKIANGTYKSDTLDHYKSIAPVASRYGVYIKEWTSTMDLDDSYPLLPSYPGGTLMTDHMVLYINAVYAANI